MPTTIYPDREKEGYKFKCDLCEKYYEVRAGRHQEITDRLEIEDIPEKQGSNLQGCNHCYEKNNDEGRFDPTSIQV